MTTIHEYREPAISVKQKNNVINIRTVHNHPVEPEYYYKHDNSNPNHDEFVCTNKRNIKKWLQCAKKNGKCDNLSYNPKYTTGFWFFKDDHPATFEYKPKVGDTIESIREMFNLKPEAIKKYKSHIFDIHRALDTNEIIKFDENDIMP